jgi:pyruvate kinase
MLPLLRTKIVCTIGPASREPEQLTKLIRAGMDVARLNFSHGDQAGHAETIRRVREAAEQVGKPVAILGDLQGPKLRMGVMREGGVPIQSGEKLVITTDDIVGEPGRVPVQYDLLPEAVREGDRILVDDGLLELVVREVSETDIVTEVLAGGILNSNKGINLPRAALDIPAITEKDRSDLAFAIEQGLDWIALSFVRTASEVWDLKGYIRQLSAFGRQTPVISKIEKPEAINNIDEIVEASDGVMVARGDLGIELSPEAVPMLQKSIIAKCNATGKPVITATQMLDSMIRNPRPTRAETSDVANAILDGSDAIMLSGETASGKYPLQAVQTMVRIAQEVERSQVSVPRRQVVAKVGRTFSEAVSNASVQMATDLSAAAIVTPTVSRLNRARHFPLPAALACGSGDPESLHAARVDAVLGGLSVVIAAEREHGCDHRGRGGSSSDRRLCEGRGRARGNGRVIGRRQRHNQPDQGASYRACARPRHGIGRPEGYRPRPPAGIPGSARHYDCAG